MSKSEVIAAVEDTWRAFRDSFERLTTTDLEISGVTGEWSIKDVVGHVAAWDLALARALTTRELGPELSDRQVEAFNRQQSVRRAKKTVAEVLTELEEARRTLRDALQSTPDGAFTKGTDWRSRIDTYSVFHHQEHAAEIKVWIDRTNRGWRSAQ
jgi:hypothetical protein